MTYQDPHTIQSIINNAKTVAIVGLSPNELRASHFVGYYLRRHGYTVIPVNPREESILGQRSYASLSDVPVHIDPALRPGLVFMTMHFPDQVDTNVLTIEATDPRSGTAEFKATAVCISKKSTEAAWTST